MTDKIALGIHDNSADISLGTNSARSPTKIYIRQTREHDRTRLNISGDNKNVPLDIRPDRKPVPLSVEHVRIIHGSPYPEYTGETVVTPKAFEEQTLGTHNTLVRDDITVLEIPYYETTNLKGGYTAIIGG